MDFTEQIASFETQILEKKGKRSDFVQQKAGITEDIRFLQQRYSTTVETISGYDTAINKLEVARDSLKALLTIEPIQARRETTTASASEITHIYEHIDTDYVDGDSGKSYAIETLLADGKTFVYKCECPKFRFERGELANGKTCKHIKRFFVSVGGRGIRAFNKTTAVSKGLASSTASVNDHANYRYL